MDSVMAASGLEHLDAKVLFTVQFNDKPKQKSMSASGRVFGVQKKSTEAMLSKLQASAHGRGWQARALAPCEQLFLAYLPHICEELGLPGLGTPGAAAAALGVIKQCSEKKGICGSGARWLSALDSSKFLARHRHVRMFIVDATIMLQNATPFNHDVDFADTLSQVFAKEKEQSFQVAAHILRDERFFQAAPLESPKLLCCACCCGEVFA